MLVPVRKLLPNRSPNLILRSDQEKSSDLVTRHDSACHSRPRHLSSVQYECSTVRQGRHVLTPDDMGMGMMLGMWAYKFSPSRQLTSPPHLPSTCLPGITHIKLSSGHRCSGATMRRSTLSWEGDHSISFLVQ